MSDEAAILAELRELFDALAVGRVTLRRDVVDERGRNFPVSDELLREGAPSIKDEEYADIFTSPVARRVAGGEQVVQDDCEVCYPDDPEFRATLVEYGGLAAQVVTPVLDGGGAVVAIVSAHQLGEARRWTPHELELCTSAARRIGALLAAM